MGVAIAVVVTLYTVHFRFHFSVCFRHSTCSALANRALPENSNVQRATSQSLKDFLLQDRDCYKFRQ